MTKEELINRLKHDKEYFNDNLQSFARRVSNNDLSGETVPIEKAYEMYWLAKWAVVYEILEYLEQAAN